MTATALSPVAVRMPEPDEAWVGFGANLGDRWGTIERAVAAFGSDVVAVSPVYETEPWGIVDQPWFLNGVLRLRWRAEPQALLARCLEIESASGRVRSERNGPRTLDLDVLLVGGQVLNEASLRVPHPGIIRRRSVLEPWADVAPGLVVPGLVEPLCTLRNRAASLLGQCVRRVEAL